MHVLADLRTTARSRRCCNQLCFFSMLVHIVYRFVPRRQVAHAGSPLGPSHTPRLCVGAKALVGCTICLCRLMGDRVIVHAGDRDPPQLSSGSGKHARAEASPCIWEAGRWGYSRRDCAEKTNYALGNSQGGACDVMLVGRGRSAKIWSLPSHSGTGVCRSWMDPCGDCAIVRGRCSALREGDGASSPPCGLPGGQAG